MLNMNSVSFGSRRFDKLNSDESCSNPRKHTAAKIIFGTATLAGISAAGLVLGHKTGVFSKGSTKLFNKVLSLAAGVADITKPPKAVKMKAKSLYSVCKALDKMNVAGEYINQYANDGFNWAKKVFKKKVF